jgi:acetylornithine deacetylase/succinyl-diaminopimelate desuccinylase-like protein
MHDGYDGIEDRGGVADREELWQRVDACLDQDYLVRTLFRLIEAPTDVPLGPETLMAPDHPKLVHYVQRVLRPEFAAAGYPDLIDAPLNQIVADVGCGDDRGSLLLMAYTPTQHNNLMREPLRPRIASGREHGFDEPCIYGQGVSQNKVHQAAMLTVLRALATAGVLLRGKLYAAINNEGRSSHECSSAILGALPERPRAGLILIGTGLDISVGNRGRVDIYVHIRGKAAHSSRPQDGFSAIHGACEAMNRIASLDVNTGDRHPTLGGRHLVPYQVTYWPVAPHTLPETAKVTYDRRLLPGDDIDAAVQQVRDAVGDMRPFEVRVERGVHMLPAMVSRDAPIVRMLRAANVAVRGVEASLCYGQGSFDAGGPCAHGVPTVMWGASGGDGLLGDDFVPLAAAWAEVRVLARLVVDYLG